MKRKSCFFGLTLRSCFVLTVFLFAVLTLYLNSYIFFYLEDGRTSIFRSEQGDSDTNGGVHIVFSTSCNLYQEWQSRALIHSARKIAGENSRITRIVSGCESSKTDAKRTVNSHPYGLADNLVSIKEIEDYARLYPNVDIHFTPTFEGSEAFPWMNKPLGIKHWLENSMHKAEDVVIILDPDMLFFRPFYKTVDGRDMIASIKDNNVLCEVSCRNRHLKEASEVESFKAWVASITEKIVPGKAIAQTYGLSSEWADRIDFTKFFKSLATREPLKMVKVKGIEVPEEFKDHPILHIERSEIRHFYSVGPPYILHIQDIQKLLPYWEKYMKPSHDDNPRDILSDMYAYSMAAMKINLPHIGFEHYMVSNVKSMYEGWSLLDPFLKTSKLHALEDLLDFDEQVPTCREAVGFVRREAINKGNELPHLVHISQFYKVSRKGKENHTPFHENIMFHKGHVPPNIFSCDLPLLKYPPRNFIQNQEVKVNRRAAFLVCTITHFVNEAVLEWKRMTCSHGFNTSELFELTSLKSCRGKKEGFDCWQGAKISSSKEWK